VSNHADRSGIQLDDSQVVGVVLNAYRRLMWLDFEQARDDPFAALNRIDAKFFDAQSLCFGQILSVIFSPAFRDK
jgi:hypothetical protein